MRSAGEALAIDNGTDRNDGRRESRDIASGHDHIDGLRGYPDEEACREGSRDGFEDCLMDIVVAFFSASVIEVVEHRFLEFLRGRDVREAGCRAGDERPGDVGHRGCDGARERGECRIPREARHHDAVDIIFEALIDTLADGIAPFVIVFAHGEFGMTGISLEEIEEISLGAEAAFGADDAGAVDLEVAEREGETPDIERIRNGIELGADEFLIGLGHLFGCIEVILVIILGGKVGDDAVSGGIALPPVG